MMVVNADFACYSFFEIGCPDMRCAPSAYDCEPQWFTLVRARAEQLLVTMPSQVRPSASNEPLRGGRIKLCKMLEEA